jgi:hypothetical protein
MNKDIHPHLAPTGWLADALVDAVLHLAASTAHLSLYSRAQTQRSRTLRPGAETPLWNELARQLRPHLRVYGNQAKLGRILGVPRQRVHEWLKSGHQLPDAERTLRLILWWSTLPKDPAKKVSRNT